MACQTSTETHPIHTTKVSAEGVEIIATLYTVRKRTALLAESAKANASLLCSRDRLILQDRVCGRVGKLRSGDLLRKSISI
jgi:hypothetical protein